MNFPATPPDPSTATRHDQHGRYPRPETVEAFREHLAEVHRRMEAACSRAGRALDAVRLLPVSKTIDEGHVRLAHAAGCGIFGENKVQEAHRKWQAMRDLPGVGWSVIGHLQTNKARLVAQFASEFQALDSLRVAKELDRRLEAEDRILDVFVQVNTSAEESKYGLAPSAVAPFVKELPSFPRLRVRGLMTLAVFSTDPARVRPCFVRLRELRERLREKAPDGIALDELSMGMSGDYEIAIEEGATVVRVGQAIFGARAIPDSHFWPTVEQGEGRA